MCGIAGMAGAKVGQVGDTEALERATSSMRHRGPDDTGLWWSDDRCVGFGHRRLAIIDLSPRGHQPMVHGDSAMSVVLNGEIYNYVELRDELRALGHSFHGDSDTEVLLRAFEAWGVDCLNRLVGMFAFALFDRHRQRLVLARDRAGEKPLFFCHRAGRLAFASEIKALLEDASIPRVMDIDALDHYLAYGYVPGSQTLIRQIRKLPAGHVLTYDLRTDEMRSWPYWQLPSLGAERVGETEELVDELDRLLSEAVRLQLRADVPVGVLLSGGIDSSLVTAMAVRHASKKVMTFTIAFPGHGVYDESRYARIVAKHFGTDHVELEAEPSTVDLLPMLARQYDQPIGDSSMIPTYLVSRLIRQHATVALGGDGGDELFGGYVHHRWLLQQERVRRLLGRPIQWLARASLPAFRLGVPGRNYVRALAGSRTQAIASMNALFDRESRRALSPALRHASVGCEAEAYKMGLCAHGGSALQQVTAVDAMTYLVDDILVKVDRASMLTSLEVRAPFLDHRIMEFAFSRVPDHLRTTASERKILPRLLAARLLPSTLDLRRKQGFSIPLHAWFKGEWGTYLESVLTQAPPELYEPSVIRSLIVGQRRGGRNAQRLYSLAMLELWRREYNVQIA
jgi:asparagine synthase (glutamine-hydrolysing)